MEIANEFITRFCEIGSKLTEKNSGPSDKLQYAHNCCSSFHMRETSEEEVSRLSDNLSDNKTMKHGDIQTNFIKQFNFSTISILNRCINEGTYPNCLKYLK